jgi:hypothetical protein
MSTDVEMPDAEPADEDHGAQDTSISDGQGADAPGQEDGPERLRALAPILIFDVGGPLAVYGVARSAGLSTVVDLVLSGVLPAIRVAMNVIRHRRLDAIGALVLSGIVLGTVVGLASGSTRLYLLDGIVPTVALGLAVVGTAPDVSLRP